MEEEEQANIGDLPLGAKRSHEPSDDDGAPLVSFLAQGKKRPAGEAAYDMAGSYTSGAISPQVSS